VPSGVSTTSLSSAVGDVEEELDVALAVICWAAVLMLELVLVLGRGLTADAAEELELGESQSP
jgi:hypothetical protein